MSPVMDSPPVGTAGGAPVILFENRLLKALVSVCYARAQSPRVKLVAAPIGRDNLGGDNEVKTCRDTDKHLKNGL